MSSSAAPRRGRATRLLLVRRSWRCLRLRVAAREPFSPRHECNPETRVVDPKVSVAAPGDRLRHDLLHLLRHDADIGCAVAALVAEAVEGNAAVEADEGDDRLLETEVGEVTATAAHVEAAA